MKTRGQKALCTAVKKIRESDVHMLLLNSDNEGDRGELVVSLVISLPGLSYLHFLFTYSQVTDFSQ